MKFTSKLITVLCILSLITACESVDVEERRSREAAELAEDLAEKGFSQGDSLSSVTLIGRQEFSVVNNRAVILTQGQSNHYLFTLTMPCFNIGLALAITIESRTNNVRPLDYVVFNPRQGTGPERCPIDGIYRLEAVEE